ncbi:MAG: SGNH/GDSL hydrolase family protein [Anaerolineae bacterium]|nr:SGNH/GDSL hydrolase family protein [Anaerolineae bacterium]
MKIAFTGDSLTKGIPGSSYFAILRKRLPQHQLINLGRGNDTVVSLYHRLARLRFDDESFDLAFLWVGVNDVSKEGSWIFRAGNALRRQPRSQSPDEFRAYYQKTLALLCRHARRVIAVAPLMKGEAIDSEWNRQIDVLANIIERLAPHHGSVEYLDLRPAFYAELADRQTSDYLQENPLRIALDILTLWSDAQVDRRAAKRGLHFTLDGVHLNSAGAEIVADMFSKAVVKEQALQSGG